MQKVIHILSRNGKYKIAIPVLIVGVILQAILIAKYLPEFLSYSNGMKNPDQLFTYDFDFIKDLYQTLGEDGRKYYGKMLNIDFLYSIVSGIGYSLLLSAIVKQKKWYITLPLFLMFSDILENISQLVLMYNFPNINSFSVNISSMFSTVKMLLSLICVSLILFFLAKNILAWLKNRKGITQ